jgi:hypothetical protein
MTFTEFSNKLLKENPGICKRLFGIEFGDFEIVLGKV